MDKFRDPFLEYVMPVSITASAPSASEAYLTLALAVVPKKKKTWQVSAVEINEPGEDYEQGDVVACGSAEFTIDGVDADGVPTAISITSPGVFESDPSGTGAAATGGSGTGLTLNLTGENTASIVEVNDTPSFEDLADSQLKGSIDGGMKRLFVLPVDDLAEAKTIVQNSKGGFFSINFDPAFNDELDDTDTWGFGGVLFATFSDREKAKRWAAKKNHCAEFENVPAGQKPTGYSLAFKLGRLLSNGATGRWTSLQYLDMPVSTGIISSGDFEALFADRVSFTGTSDQFGNENLFFVAGGHAIHAPYVYELFTLRVQSWAHQYIKLNEPDHGIDQAADIQIYLDDRIQRTFISTKLIRRAFVSIEPTADNFLMNGEIGITEVKATWRIPTHITQGIEG